MFKENDSKWFKGLWASNNFQSGFTEFKVILMPLWLPIENIREDGGGPLLVTNKQYNQIVSLFTRSLPFRQRSFQTQFSSDASPKNTTQRKTTTGLHKFHRALCTSICLTILRFCFYRTWTHLMIIWNLFKNNPSLLLIWLFLILLYVSDGTGFISKFSMLLFLVHMEKILDFLTI